MPKSCHYGLFYHVVDFAFRVEAGVLLNITCIVPAAIVVLGGGGGGGEIKLMETYWRGNQLRLLQRVRHGSGSGDKDQTYLRVITKLPPEFLLSNVT